MPESYRPGSLIAEGVIVLVLTAAMAVLCVWETREKDVEVLKRLERITDQYQTMLGIRCV